MLYEPSIMPSDVGWIEVICGGMFSGKTEELIRRARRAQIAGQKVIIVKPAIDKRYSKDEIVSHNQNSLSGLTVDTADQIILQSGDADVICIDEAQFFDDRLVDVANALANDGKRVITAGLDMDFEGKPFDPIPNLMAVAEYVTKLHAICAESGMVANYSQRVVNNNQKILLGEADSYEPRSRPCYRPPVDKPKARSQKPIPSDPPELEEDQQETNQLDDSSL